MKKFIILFGLVLVLLCAGEGIAQQTQKYIDSEKKFCVPYNGYAVLRCEDSYVICYYFSKESVHCKFK